MTVVLALAATGAPTSTQAVGDTRTLSFYNVNTEETLTIGYKKNGRFVPAAMRRINHMMRDWRRNEATVMDPELIDLIWELHAELGSREPVHLISGYRSSRTNEALRRQGGGQAQQSRHVLGKAADVHFPDISVTQLRNSALVRERGGVGYYPGSRIPFVHLDTGRVRHWPRLPRQELAELFPSGRTAHVPADGRPLTARDGQRALARLRARGEDSRVQLASATSTPPIASANPDRAEPAPARPPLAVAALAPSQRFPGAPPNAASPSSRLPWLDGSTAAPAPERPPAGPRLGAVDLGLTASFEGRHARRAPVFGDGSVAAGDDSAHPQALSYRPYPVLALMTETGTGPRHALMEMAHPEQDRIAVLLTAPVTPVPMRFQQGAGAAAHAPGPRFTGPAVPEIVASAHEPARRGKLL